MPKYSSVGPKMAETSLEGRTLIKLFRVSAVIFHVLTAFLLVQPTAASGRISVTSVNFVGFLNDLQQINHNGLSALLEVDGHFPAGFASGGLNFVASESEANCKSIFGRAAVLQPSSSKSGQRTSGASGGNADATSVQLSLPVHSSKQERTLYLCAGHQSGRWHHLGSASRFALPTVTTGEEVPIGGTSGDDVLIEPYDTYPSDNEVLSRQGRDIAGAAPTININDTEPTRVIALRLNAVSKDVGYGDDGGIEARKGFEVPLTLYGIGLRNDSEIIFTSAQGEFGDNCQSGEVHVKTSSYNLVANDEGTVATLTIPAGDLPAIKGQEQFYVCLKSKDDVMSMHQGSDGEGLKIKVYVLILPVWLMVIFIVILLCLSGLFSGLNLGLMALDQTELKIVQNTGTDKEKDYANKIFPIRSHGNFLLCSLLLGNVLVNNTLTILLDTLTSGLVAVIGATMGIVVFGEIIPQAICSRHGLAVGAYTIWLTKIFMVLTFPLSYPISKLLDCILGAEIGTVYDKKKLIELLRVTNDDNDLEKEEVDIVTGALVYKEKTVLSVMTKLDDCYMLPMRSSLNFATVSEIREQGYSRIPVYDGDRANIVHVLFAKDLMFIDPDDNMPLAMVCEFYNNDVNFVFHDTPLNVMFNEFKSGEKGHMAFVQDVNTSGEGDPFYETIGLVTLEDIIEEIIQQEIVDETDVITDNKTKKKRRREKFKGGVDGTAFHQMFGEPTRKVTIGPQLTLAVFQYLTTSIEPFKSCYISDAVLKRLLTMDVYREIKIKTENQRKISSDKEDEEDLIIMHKGKSIDYFILIIEGKVEVNIGREELIFESGPFTYFGIQTLNQVIQSPSSPILAYKAAQAVAAGAAAGGGGVNPAGTPPSVMSSHDLVGSNSKQSNLRKASTQHSIDIPANMNMNKRNSQDAGSSRMSVTPMYAPFIPDYTIKAVTDVLYLKLKRNTYLRAIKASLMGKKQSHSGELNEKELDRFLAKVNEDEGGDHEMSMMLRTPVLTSPNKSEQSLDQDHKLHKINPSSGTSTPTMAAKGEVMRGQVSGSHMNNNRNIGRGKEEHGGAEAWDKDSVANALKQKKVGGGSSATASTTEIVSLAAEKAAASVEKAAAGADQGEDEFWDKDTLAVARDKAKTAASAGASKLESEAANVLNKMEAVGNDLKSNGGSALMSSVRDRDPDAAEGGDSETALKDKSIGKAS